MKAVILAAGEGLRLRPFTINRPKGMIPLANRPILEYIVNALKDNGVRDIIMVVGYSKEKIMNHFGNGRDFGVSITYVEQKRQLGTAHAILQVKPHVDSEFLVVAGDNLIDSIIVRDLVANRGKVSMALTVSSQPSKYGVVRLEGNKVIDVQEKPDQAMSNVISTGLFCLPPQIFAIIEEMLRRPRTDITSAFKHIIENKLETIVGVLSKGSWQDVIYPWDILKVNFEAVTRSPIFQGGTIESGAVIKGPVSIGRGTVIKAGTYIEGPVVIGSGCEIGPYAVISPTTSIGDDSIVGAFSHVSNSVIFSSTSIGANSSLANCVVGEGTTIGSHFIASSGPAHILHEDGCHDVPLVGALIGEDTKIGFRVCVQSGVIIGSGCNVASGNSVRSNLQSGAIMG